MTRMLQTQPPQGRSAFCLLFAFGDIPRLCCMTWDALAPDTLRIDGLATDPTQRLTQVEQGISNTDSFIAKLWADPSQSGNSLGPAVGRRCSVVGVSSR